MVCGMSGGASPITASQRTGTVCSTAATSPSAWATTPRTPSQPTTTWPSTLDRSPVGVHHRDPDRVVALVDADDRAAEAQVGTGGHQRLAQPGHQLVLRVDVVRPAAGDRPVVEDDPLERGPELAAVVLDAEVEDVRGEALLGEQLDRAVLDGARLRDRPQLRLGMAFEEDERDPLALEQVPDDEAGRTGSDDDDRCRVDPHRPDLRAAPTPRAGAPR